VVAAAAVKKKKVPVEVEAAGDLNGASELAGERATDLVGRSVGRFGARSSPT